MTREFAPRVLAPGAHIAVIAPSGPFDVEGFELGLARLRTRYEVSHAPDIYERKGFLAGGDARRLGELRDALARPDVDALLAARGGYGSTRILPLIAAEEIAAHRPLLIGFSDITGLHALWAQAEVGSIHGSMVARLGSSSELQFERFCAALEGRFGERIEGLTPFSLGTTDGILLGGNLAILTALIGTPEFPPLEDAVLFLEDIGERPYRVDRMLTTWRNAGALRGVRGIVLGAFSECAAGPDCVSTEDVLRERLGNLGLPVVAGLPAGHVDDNLELPFGRRVTLDANTGTLHLHSPQRCS